MEGSESTKWAVIEVGGKQHLVSEGAKLRVNRLTNKEGETLSLKSLLDGTTPVTLTVTGETLGDKVRGLKFKNKVRYIRRYGHRQQLTTLQVTSIGAAKAAPKSAEVKPATKAVAKKPAVKKVAKKANG